MNSRLGTHAGLEEIQVDAPFSVSVGTNGCGEKVLSLILAYSRPERFNQPVPLSEDMNLNPHMDSTSQQFDVAIAGGWAGRHERGHSAGANAWRSSICWLRKRNFRAPNCVANSSLLNAFAHFQRLGVLDQMLVGWCHALRETVFYSARGHKVAVPSEWFKSNSAALGLSRSEMDYGLLKRAKAAGASRYRKRARCRSDFRG